MIEGTSGADIQFSHRPSDFVFLLSLHFFCPEYSESSSILLDQRWNISHSSVLVFGVKSGPSSWIYLERTFGRSDCLRTKDWLVTARPFFWLSTEEEERELKFKVGMGSGLLGSGFLPQGLCYGPRGVGDMCFYQLQTRAPQSGKLLWFLLLWCEPSGGRLVKKTFFFFCMLHFLVWQNPYDILSPIWCLVIRLFLCIG